MIKIGLLSDTHNTIDDKTLAFFENCSEVWHAGDIGDMQVIEKLEKNHRVRAVFGNIDGSPFRHKFPETLRFYCEDVDVMITHIAGYPGKYYKEITDILKLNPPGLLISGHSHILKVMFDKKYNLLFMNPGAAGNYGFHKVKTAVRFIIDGKNIRDLEVLELPRFENL